MASLSGVEGVSAVVFQATNVWPLGCACFLAGCWPVCCLASLPSADRPDAEPGTELPAAGCAACVYALSLGVARCALCVRLACTIH